MRTVVPVGLLLLLSSAHAQPEGILAESKVSRTVERYGNCVANSLEQAADLGKVRFETVANRTCAGHRASLRELLRNDQALAKIDRRILDHLRGQSDLPHGTVIGRPEQ